VECRAGPGGGSGSKTFGRHGLRSRLGRDRREAAPAGRFGVPVGTPLRSSPRRRDETVRAQRNLLVLVAGSLAVTTIALLFRGSSHAPTARAALETGLTICGLASASLLWAYWKRTHRMSDLLLAIALLAMTVQDFGFLAGPAMLGVDSSTLRAPAPLTVRLVIAAVFAGAALALRRELPPRGLHARTLIAVTVICLIAPAVVTVVGHETDDWFVAGHGGAASAIAIALTVPAIVLLLLGAARFVYGEYDVTVKALLAGALILLAGSWLYSLLMPGLTTASVSGNEYLRAGAYGLILLAAVRMWVLRNRMETRETAVRERRRLIGDLHDGMAQDLAFIAAYSEKLARDLGPDHPMVLAARRALAFSRNAIVDLAASDAPTTGEALRALADELTLRHGVRVKLQIEGEELPAAEREAVVRIAREAIVNAVRHGEARNVTVSLQARGRELTLTITDDGRGLSGGLIGRGRSSYGFRTMRQRAEAIGGQLRTRRAPAGGLAVELTIS
jgi:signal transduction histidine kinase